MKTRPILFNGDMVRAILDGRKTQTRRVIKPQPHDISDRTSAEVNAAWQEGFVPVKCPFGAVGDLMWVRECFFAEHARQFHQLHYRADAKLAPYGLCKLPDGREYGGGWKPSIHMPRTASRITLEITDVRVERLQDISEADAIAEGIIKSDGHQTLYRDYGGDKTYAENGYGLQRTVWVQPVPSYQSLWQYINGKKHDRNWNANPWVWVIEFKPHMINVDAYLARIEGA